jgi:hypothetical protein
MELQGEKYGPTECSSRTRSSPSAGACPASTGRNAAAKQRHRTQLIVEPACGSNDNGGDAYCSQVNARKYGRRACIHTRRVCRYQWKPEADIMWYLFRPLRSQPRRFGQSAAHPPNSGAIADIAAPRVRAMNRHCFWFPERWNVCNLPAKSRVARDRHGMGAAVRSDRQTLLESEGKAVAWVTSLPMIEEVVTAGTSLLYFFGGNQHFFVPQRTSRARLFAPTFAVYGPASN